MTIENFEEGDIFHWRWKDETRHYSSGVSTAYWCKSRIAIFSRGSLCDTYWGSEAEHPLDLTEVELEFKGNANEMKRIQAWEKDWYRSEDIVNMNHSNNSNAPVYLKTGATRDAQTMRDHFAYKIERAESEARWAVEKVEKYRAALAAVDRGELDGNFPSYS